MSDLSDAFDIFTRPRIYPDDVVLIDEQRIYDELVRSRLNTKELRLAFIEKGARGKRLKPPGTPMLTIDGQVIIESKIKRSAPIPDSEARPAFSIQATQKPAEPISEPQADFPEPPVQEAAIFEEPVPEPAGILPLEEMEAPVAELEFTSEPESESELEFLDSLETESPFALEQEPVPAEGLETTEPVATETPATDTFFDSWFNMESELTAGESEPQPDPLEAILETDGDISFDGVSIADNMANTSVGDLVAEAITETSETDYPMEEGSPGDERKWGGHHIDHFESGRELYRDGQYVKAIEAFWKAIAEDPEYIEAYQCMGDTFFRMGRLDKAKEAYEVVKRLDPDNLSVIENLGVIFANKGDYKKAVWQWAEVLKRNPERRDIIERIRRIQRVIRQRMF